MNGRRLSDGAHPFSEPGDYWRQERGRLPRYEGEGRMVWMLHMPDDIVRYLGPHHHVTEHEDGTISVEEALCVDIETHLTLRRGVWRCGSQALP